MRLSIAGDGETSRDIKNYVEQNGLSDHVFIFGLLDQSALLDFLQSLDIYAHCTFGETMSTSIMQALACGLPIIASDVEGVSNMVKEDFGFLYASESVGDLKHKMKHLILCKKMQMRISQLNVHFHLMRR